MVGGAPCTGRGESPLTAVPAPPRPSNQSRASGWGGRAECRANRRPYRLYRRYYKASTVAYFMVHEVKEALEKVLGIVGTSSDGTGK